MSGKTVGVGSGAVVLVAWIYSILSKHFGWADMPPEVAAVLGGAVYSGLHILEQKLGVDIDGDGVS